jgi:hypothetical protein
VLRFMQRLSHKWAASRDLALAVRLSGERAEAQRQKPCERCGSHSGRADGSRYCHWCATVTLGEILEAINAARNVLGMRLLARIPKGAPFYEDHPLYLALGGHWRPTVSTTAALVGDWRLPLANNDRLALKVFSLSTALKLAQIWDTSLNKEGDVFLPFVLRKFEQVFDGGGFDELRTDLNDRMCSGCHKLNPTMRLEYAEEDTPARPRIADAMWWERNPGFIPGEQLYSERERWSPLDSGGRYCTECCKGAVVWLDGTELFQVEIEQTIDNSGTPKLPRHRWGTTPVNEFGYATGLESRELTAHPVSLRGNPDAWRPWVEQARNRGLVR